MINQLINDLNIIYEKINGVSYSNINGDNKYEILNELFKSIDKNHPIVFAEYQYYEYIGKIIVFIIYFLYT